MRAQLNQLCIIASITWKAIVVRAFIWLRSNLFAFPAEWNLNCTSESNIDLTAIQNLSDHQRLPNWVLSFNIGSTVPRIFNHLTSQIGVWADPFFLATVYDQKLYLCICVFVFLYLCARSRFGRVYSFWQRSPTRIVIKVKLLLRCLPAR